MANWIRNFGIRIGCEGRGIWALRWKLVGLPAGLAEPSGEVGPVSQAPVDSHCFAGPSLLPNERFSEVIGLFGSRITLTAWPGGSNYDSLKVAKCLVI